MDAKLFFLNFLVTQGGKSNWYKYHRKYFGDDQYGYFLDNLDETIAQLEEQDLIKQIRNPQVIATLEITDKGRDFIGKNDI